MTDIQNDITPSQGTNESNSRTEKKLKQRVEQGAEHVAQAAAHKMSGAREAVKGGAATAEGLVHRAEEQTRAIAEDVRSVAVDSYQAARRYAHDVADNVGELARERGAQTYRYARRVSSRGARFASTHALPLTFVGASLGWLAWSVLRESRRPLVIERSYPPMQPREIEVRPLPSDLRYESRYEADVAAERPASKLLGVRMSEDGYPIDRRLP